MLAEKEHYHGFLVRLAFLKLYSHGGYAQAEE